MALSPSVLMDWVPFAGRDCLTHFQTLAGAYSVFVGVPCLVPISLSTAERRPTALYAHPGCDCYVAGGVIMSTNIQVSSNRPEFQESGDFCSEAVLTGGVRGRLPPSMAPFKP